MRVLVAAILCSALLVVASCGVPAEPTATPVPALGTSVCSIPTETPPLADTPTMTERAAPTATATASPTATPTATSTSTPSGSPSATSPASIEVRREHLEGLGELISDALRKGKGANKTVPELAARGLLLDGSSFKDFEGLNAVPLADEDFDGDGLLEMAVTIFVRSPVRSSFYPVGELWVVSPEGVVFRLGSTMAEEDRLWGAPLTVFTGDVAGDRVADIVTKSVLVGADTVVGMYHVISAHSGSYQLALNPGSELELAAEPIRTYNDITNEGWETLGVSMTMPQERFLDFNSDGGYSDEIVH